jgi:hypothetical protein
MGSHEFRHGLPPGPLAARATRTASGWDVVGRFFRYLGALVFGERSRSWEGKEGGGEGETDARAVGRSAATSDGEGRMRSRRKMRSIDRRRAEADTEAGRLRKQADDAKQRGTLHEVFAAATCLRAGFTIENEDERDPTSRHTEFTATDKMTGERFSVEAKSKHRPGVLGQAGAPEPQEKLRLTYGRLINEASAKNAKHPLVIFLDTNLPFKSAHHVYGNDANVPSKYIRQLCERIGKEHDGKYPYAMLVLTNIPHHYARAHEADPPKQFHAMMSEHPASKRGIALSAISSAIPLYGNIPDEFPTF